MKLRSPLTDEQLNDMHRFAYRASTDDRMSENARMIHGHMLMAMEELLHRRSCDSEPTTHDVRADRQGPHKTVSTLERDLTSLLNRHSVEGTSDTPDFILSRFMLDSLRSFTDANNARESWHGRGGCRGPDPKDPTHRDPEPWRCVYVDSTGRRCLFSHHTDSCHFYSEANEKP